MTSRSHGFTLLEVMVALAVSAGVSLAGWTFYGHHARDLAHQFNALEASEAVRASTAFITREIRMAAYDPTSGALSAPGDRGIAEAGTHVLHLESDKNANGAIDTGATDPSAESIVFAYDPERGRIVRTAGGVSQTLVDGIPPEHFTFAYFDIDGTPLSLAGSPPRLEATARDAVALVELRIGVAVGTGPSTSAFTFTSRAAIRARILDRL